MDEQEWLSCEDPNPMLELLKGCTSERKLRLFALACCHRVKRLITDPHAEQALAFAERHAEKSIVHLKGRIALEQAARKALAAAYVKVHSIRFGLERARYHSVADALHAATNTVNPDPFIAASYTASYSCFAVAWEAVAASGGNGYPSLPASLKYPEKVQQSRLLRDIFSNPFRPVTPPAPSVLLWNAGTVKRLAKEAYQQRLPEGTLDNPRLAVLADALEEAGSVEVALLSHLRDRSGAHVRGCWAVDLVLQKE
jgi:alkylation response protein AidB-like acyl-CoA dehydrogenase